MSHLVSKHVFDNFLRLISKLLAFIFWIFFKLTLQNFYFYFLNCTYFSLDRGEGREKGRETSMCDCLSCTPYWRPGLQPSHVPWVGIEPATLWFTGWHSIHWATPARAISEFLKLPLWPNMSSIFINFFMCLGNKCTFSVQYLHPYRYNFEVLWFQLWTTTVKWVLNLFAGERSCLQFVENTTSVKWRKLSTSEVCLYYLCNN